MWDFLVTTDLLQILLFFIVKIVMVGYKNLSLLVMGLQFVNQAKWEDIVELVLMRVLAIQRFEQNAPL